MLLLLLLLLLLDAGLLLPHESVTVRAVVVEVLEGGTEAGDPGERPAPAVKSLLTDTERQRA